MPSSARSLAFRLGAEYCTKLPRIVRSIFHEAVVGRVRTDVIFTLRPSPGGLDDCIKLWDFQKTTEDILAEEVNMAQAGDVKTSTDLLMASFATKHTPVLVLHFTRRNLLLAAGSFQS